MTKEEMSLELKTLTDNLEGKSKTEIKNAIEAFEAKHKELLETKFATPDELKTATDD